jgi:hypothetical protein
MAEPGPSADHLQESVIELLEPIMDEMVERFGGRLSDKDLTAALTAVQKAGMEGARAGVVELAARLSEEGGTQLNLQMNAFQPVDRWAEQYREDA